MLRSARRRAGLSQRGLAARSGISASTIAAVEAGRREPGLGTLRTLLEAAGVQLGLEPLLPRPCDHLHRYLRLSLVERAYLATGGRWHPVHDRRCLPWRELWELAAFGRVELAGRAAVGVWTPVVADRVQVRFTGRPSASPPTADLVERRGPAAGAGRFVPVRLLGRTVHVQPPDLLVAQVEDPAESFSLRVAARLLDDAEPVDDAHRRPPAHRDPDPRADDHRVQHTKAFGRRRPPPPQDRRGWRLDGPVSLAQWLRQYGYPT